MRGRIFIMLFDYKYNIIMNFIWLVIYISLGYLMGIKGCVICMYLSNINI